MSVARQLVLRADPARLPDGRNTWLFPRLQIEERTLPPLAGGAVRIRMAYAGLCGTDVHLVSAHPETGAIRCSAPVSIPPEGRVIGHEGIGEVVEIGPDAGGRVAVGDWVVPASVLSCGHCGPCLSGAPNQCLEACLIGLEHDGVFSTFADLPEKLLVVVTAHADKPERQRALACLEPAATALQACDKAELGPSDQVVVFGAGPIGFFAALIARKVKGCARVTVVEPAQYRRDHARLWCDEVLSPEDYLARGDRADVLVEASGALENVRRSLLRLQARGRVVLLGRSGEPLLIDAVDHMISEAITIRGCRGHLGGYMEQALALYAAGQLPLEAAITGRIAGVEAIAKMLDNPGAIADAGCKIVASISPDDGLGLSLRDDLPAQTESDRSCAASGASSVMSRKEK